MYFRQILMSLIWKIELMLIRAVVRSDQRYCWNWRSYWCSKWHFCVTLQNRERAWNFQENRKVANIVYGNRKVANITKNSRKQCQKWYIGEVKHKTWGKCVTDEIGEWYAIERGKTLIQVCMGLVVCEWKWVKCVLWIGFVDSLYEEKFVWGDVGGVDNSGGLNHWNME